MRTAAISLSTHVLDTGAGARRTACWSALPRRHVHRRDAHRRRRPRPALGDGLDPGTYRLVFHPPSPFFKRVELEVELDDGHYHVPLLVSPVLVRELPRQLSVEELAPLFSGRTRLVDELAEREDPLGVAEEVALALPEDDQVAALATHPRDRRAVGGAARRRAGGARGAGAPEQEYERRFGFAFVVFVDGRTRAELAAGAARAARAHAREELETGLRELCAIARDRWTRTT